MHFRKFFLVIILLNIQYSIFNFQSKAQTDFTNDSKKVEIIYGKKYYIHIVQKGETLYAISKKYEVDIKDIVLENPLSINGLKTGQSIKIPIAVKTRDPRTLDGKYFFHTVEAGETFYSLSKKYLISADEIKFANPDLAGGLKAGMTIRIPLVKKILLDTIFQKDTTYNNIALDTNINIQEDSLVFRDKYNIALMLPFYLDMNDTIENNKEFGDPEEIYSKSKIALEFYEGALLALDSMKKQGISLRFFVYDTRNDSNTVIKILQREEMPEIDLIVGPLYRSNLLIVAGCSEKNNIKIVSPLIATNKILIGNPNISKAKPCLETHVEKIASYVLQEYMEKNILVIHNKNHGEKKLFEVFNRSFFQPAQIDTVNGTFQGIINPKTEYTVASVIKEVEYDEERQMEAIEEVLSIADTNVIIIPSSSQVFVSKIISGLYGLKDDYNMIVFGLPSWEYFTNIEIEYLHELNVHIATSSYIDYNNEAIISFEKKYFNKFKTYPGNFAFLGFDVMYYYLNVLKNFGYNFSTHLPKITNAGLCLSFRYNSTGVGNGYENKNVFILKYIDFEMVRVDLVDW